jgi:hypothetical protein
MNLNNDCYIYISELLSSDILVRAANESSSNESDLAQVGFMKI